MAETRTAHERPAIITFDGMTYTPNPTPTPSERTDTENDQ